MKNGSYPHNKNNLEEYIKGLILRKYTLKQIASITGYTEVHLSNLKKKYQQIGKAAFINGHRGKPSPRKISDEVKKEVIRIYNNDFEGFNFTFFKKALAEFYHISLSYKTVYKILSNAGVNSPETHKIPKKDKIHRPRYRREQGGDMVQIDATPYQWFLWAGDTSYYTLHGAIDDAEEKITGLCMTENECSYGYYDILEQTIDNFGLMFDIYSDRSAIFCVSPKDKDKLTIQEQLAGVHEKRTQWQRILSDLHINQILAWSPQAKGRVERMWRTIQGRLPWYFKHYKIKTMEAANDFLKKEYIKIFNDEFSIVREKPAVWRKPPKDYKKHLCSMFERTTNSAGVISFQGYKFQVLAPDCAKKKIQLCIYKDGMKVLIDGLYYKIRPMEDLTDGIDERISVSLKNIIYQYMLTDVKKICA